jgi:hypothetical protein
MPDKVLLMLALVTTQEQAMKLARTAQESLDSERPRFVASTKLIYDVEIKDASALMKLHGGAGVHELRLGCIHEIPRGVPR